MNIRAIGVEEINAVDASEINGGEVITGAMIAWGTALGAAFTAGFAWGYSLATE